MIDFSTGKLKSIYFLITIDTECDKDIHWKIQRPIRFHSVLDGIPNRLTPFFQAYSLRPTYLLSPEVIRDNSSCRILEKIPNCELGTHLHGEFIAPISNFSADATDIPPSGYSPEIEKIKLENLTTLFQNKFGYAPKSFRAGRFGLSRYTLTYLDDLGYSADSSVTPFRILDYPSGTLNYWGYPTYSYQIHKSTIVEIPVSTSIPALQKYPLPFLKFLGHTGSFRKPILRQLGFSKEPYWIRPFRAAPSMLVNWAEEILTNWPENKPALINIMFHNVEVIPGASPYARTENDVQVLFKSLQVLVNALSKRYSLIPVTMSEFYDENRTNYPIPKISS